MLNQPPFPTTRMRRLRTSETLRAMVRETHLRIDDLIYPIFVRHGSNVKNEIGSMPGQFQWSMDRLDEIVGTVESLAIPAVILFGIPVAKDDTGKVACNADGIVQEAVSKIKRISPKTLVITDLCFCEYTSHGHCGPLKETPRGQEVDNDSTLQLLAAQAVSHAKAGADIIAPSGMMDGMIGAIRRGLDEASFELVPIMSYAIKFASGYYGPFREAAESTPSFGDRRTYQMDPANVREAMREAELDVAEGADMLMVKPGLPYLDVLARAKDRFGLPMAVYNVSGEYAMVKAAAANGWIDERRIVMETLLGFKRAGADMIITYHALDAARWLREDGLPGI